MRQLANLKGASLPDQASDMLKEFIIAKQVHIGNYLPPEHELCKKLGIGRSTLREAITILESKGLVKRFHGQGVKVVNESKRATADLFQLFMMREGSTIHDLIEVRTIIEMQTVVLATERATQTDLDSIKTALSIMKSKDVSLEEYIQADIDFHLQIAKATHNNVLLVILETIRPLLHNAIVATLQSNPRPEQSLHYHEKIYSAIENRDKEGASKAMTDHLKGTEAMIMN
jgi:GntR family transcriptional repressor for pyruvate dehydrogenase complex